MNSRPPIPSKIKRKVRQRCGFGCVICGLPIYEYDHISGFANVKRHRVEELTLLCPQHHAEKTKGLLPDVRVNDANRDPFNLKKGGTSPYALWFNGAAPEIVLGQQLFTCDDPRRPTVMLPVVVNRYCPLGFTLDTKGLLLNLDALDSKNNRILYIKESELILSTTIWDATFVGTTLTIREKPRGLSLSLEFHPPHRIVIARYHICSGGVTIDIDKTKIQFSGNDIPNVTLAGNGTISANIGVLIGDAPSGLGVGIKVGP